MLPRVLSLLESRGLLGGYAVSEGPAHLELLAREALVEGRYRLALLGGDGTAHEVLNGLMAAGPDQAALCTLGMIGVGTGNDWLRTMGMPSRPEAAVRTLAAGHWAWHDAGLIEYGEGLRQRRYFLNIAGAGFDGEVTRRVRGWKGLLAGRKVSYWLTILRTLFDYQLTEIDFRTEDSEQTLRTLTLAAGIGRYNGGGMKQLPEARYDDGLLDATVIGQMSTLEMVWHLPKVMSGSFVRLPEVHTYRAREFRFHSRPPVWIEADGEVLGHCPARITCLPKAFRVLIPGT
jgi:diacylglycerol kinase (ATP)